MQLLEYNPTDSAKISWTLSLQTLDNKWFSNLYVLNFKLHRAGKGDVVHFRKEGK